MTVAKSRAVTWPTIVGVCFVVAATVHAYQFAVESRHTWGLGGLSPYPLVQLFFVLSFLACAFGFFVRGNKGLLTSILALVAVLLAYVYWWLHSSSWRAALEHPFYREYPQFAPPFLLGLVKARWWDIAILIFVVILLVWELFVLIKRRRVRIQ